MTMLGMAMRIFLKRLGCLGNCRPTAQVKKQMMFAALD